MAQNSFNVEVIPALKTAVEHLTESKVRMIKGVAASKEVAEDSGVEKLIKSAEAMEAGTIALGKTMDENVESMGVLIKYYTDIEEALTM